MNSLEAHRLLRQTMNEHGLSHVQSYMNGRMTSTFGRYRYNRYDGTKLIELSVKLVEVNDEARVMRTILHEIAHALTEGHGHDAVWRAKCRQIGGDGIARYSMKDTNTVERKRSTKLYTLECQRCGFTGGRYRRKMNGYLHRGCRGELISIELQ